MAKFDKELSQALSGDEPVSDEDEFYEEDNDEEMFIAFGTINGLTTVLGGPAVWDVLLTDLDESFGVDGEPVSGQRGCYEARVMTGQGVADIVEMSYVIEYLEDLAQ